MGITLAGASMAMGIAQGVAGFFTSYGARKRRAREAAARKQRAIKTEGLLVGAARNTNQDILKQKKFLNTSYDTQRRQDLGAYDIGLAQSLSTQAFTGMAQSGSAIQATDYFKDQFKISQEQSALQFAESNYQLSQQQESRLRDIQGSLLELSAYSGNDINVLSTYGIGGSNVV